MTAPACCFICNRPGARLDAGGDVGLVHPLCFDRQDRQEEAEELGLVALFGDLPPQFVRPPAPPRTRWRRPPRRARTIAAAVEACRGI